ncbi:MAG: alpha/beta hydrolase [Erysipelotrichaceae bacterium]
MFKKKKFWIILFSIILVLFVSISAFAGNFLVDYAITVDEAGNIGSMGNEKYTGIQDTKAQKDYDKWVKDIKTNVWIEKNEEGLSLWSRFYENNKDSHKYILAIHGYTVDNRDIAPAIKPFYEKGYHVLTPDQRGRGHSEGKYLGMGYFEKNDVVMWVDKIVEKDPQAEIILYGESMGAATVMMASGEKLPKNVKAVIEDCGYTTAYEMFKDQLKERFSLPEFPFLPAAQVFAKVRAGFNFSDASAIDQIKKTKLPILFIHGGSDDYVPTRMGLELYKSYKGPKQLLIIKGAGHGASADVDPDKYYKTVFHFIDTYVNK